jgi:branched-chain amino acid transport system ATP-binding protein
VLELQRVDAYYGKSHVLHGIDLQVRPGEIVALLGRNGAGKTTLLKTIVGLVRQGGGQVAWSGKSLSGLPTHAIAKQGICLVPEHRGIFSLLTVDENLDIARRRDARWTVDDAYKLFPRLRERRRNGGGMLSGGEQQMLAIARALVNGPQVLLLDEPTEGLAPVIVNEIASTLASIRSSGLAVLLVEQNLRVCERLADRVYILDQGRIVHAADAAAFRAAEEIKTRYLSPATSNQIQGGP